MKSSSAENIFRTLSNEWFERVARSDRNHGLPCETSTASLACLLLAVEWGTQMTEEVLPFIDKNVQKAIGHWDLVPFAQIEALVWRLCAAATSGRRTEDPTVVDLLELFNHRQSAVREWGMTMGWFVRSWFSPGVAELLLKNVADTLGAVRMAMGLAYGTCENSEQLEKIISEYIPEDFTEQFKDRIETFRNEGFALSQYQLVAIELNCRRLVEKKVFGQPCC